MNIAIIAVAIIVALTILHKLVVKIDIMYSKAETFETRIVSRKKATDSDGVTRYYVTFEFINGDTLELAVPGFVYEIAKNKVTGRLTYQSTRFIRFIQEGNKHFKEAFKKEY